MNANYPVLETLTKDGIDFQHMKGAPLAVFLAVALHADRKGWTCPSRKLLSQETGYSISTISRTLSNLCRLKVNGKRILLRCRPTETGTLISNYHIIFPSREEITRYE